MKYLLLIVLAACGPKPVESSVWTAAEMREMRALEAEARQMDWRRRYELSPSFHAPTPAELDAEAARLLLGVRRAGLQYQSRLSSERYEKRLSESRARRFERDQRLLDRIAQPRDLGGIFDAPLVVIQPLVHSRRRAW